MKKFVIFITVLSILTLLSGCGKQAAENTPSASSDGLASQWQEGASQMQNIAESNSASR